LIAAKLSAVIFKSSDSLALTNTQLIGIISFLVYKGEIKPHKYILI
jgi:hypothetical protein